jgi:hypothetical protein
MARILVIDDDAALRAVQSPTSAATTLRCCGRRSAITVMVAVTLVVTVACATPTRRRVGTDMTHVGVTALLLGAAAEGTAAGLGDHPVPRRGFEIAGAVTAGAGVIALGIGLYMRATSPREPPDAVSLDPVRQRHRWERRVGVVLASLGGLATAVGVAHAIGAVRDSTLAEAQCVDGNCDADGNRLRSRSATLRLAAELLIGPGIVGAVGGIMMYRSAPDVSISRVQIIPTLTDDRIGAAIVGRF